MQLNQHGDMLKDSVRNIQGIYIYFQTSITFSFFISDKK